MTSELLLAEKQKKNFSDLIPAGVEVSQALRIQFG